MTSTHAPRVMVIRTADEEKEWILKELKAGRLRQGWGLEGSQLAEDGSPIPAESWVERYTAAVRKHWDQKASTRDSAKRYRILSGMLNLREGDLVVVPKMPAPGEFAIVRVAGRYTFQREHFKTKTNDFGHVIPVEVSSIRYFPHSSSLEARLISNKFKGYQAAVNNVWDEAFSAAVASLMSSKKAATKKTIGEGFDEIRESLLTDFLAKVRQIGPGDLEKLVLSVFEKAGYRCHKTHHFDKQGGDADLVLSTSLPLISSVADMDLTVFVQVKQKFGKDSADVHGVEQLAMISADKPQSIRILISTVDDFSPACRAKAEEESVILINGMQLADMLSRNL